MVGDLLFDEECGHTVEVEDEILGCGVDVLDYGVHASDLGGLGEDEDFV